MKNDELNLGVSLGMVNSKKEIDDLNTRAKELRKTLSEIEMAGGKGSDNWKKYKTELKGVEITLMQEAVKNSEAGSKKNGSASDRTSFAGHVKRARDGPSRYCNQTAGG